MTKPTPSNPYGFKVTTPSDEDYLKAEKKAWEHATGKEWSDTNRPAIGYISYTDPKNPVEVRAPDATYRKNLEDTTPKPPPPPANTAAKPGTDWNQVYMYIGGGLAVLILVVVVGMYV
jgi:hypothetical protein